MADKPLVTIVIPVYNGSNYLREAIDSALGQTYERIEVLVVDDGSDDGGATEGIARSFGSRIRYIRKPNGGVATALNTAIEHMEGQYFSWLSHDDLYDPAKVAAQVGELARLQVEDAVVYCGFHEVDARGRILATHVRAAPSGDVITEILETFIHGCSLLVPKKCFEVAGLFNPALRSTQDNDMWLRIALAGFSFHFVPRALVLSRQHPDQGSRTMVDHNREREEWYRQALHALGPEGRGRRADVIARILLRKGHDGAFYRLVRFLWQDSGARPALALVTEHGPALLRLKVISLVRRIPGVVWLKRRILGRERSSPVAAVQSGGGNRA